ncbi:MAG: zinc ABC transporter ATP-binding protein ZnuC [Pseudomonadales bacterium]
MSHNQDIVKLSEVVVSYRSRKVVDQVNLHLHRDCITTLIGPNGAGKTTLVKTVLGLVKPTQGTVWRQPGLRIGYMPQKLYVDATFPMTVRRFLQLGRRENIEQVLAALDLVGIEKLLESSVHGLSGGEMQRVLLARALLREPELLVLDEPVQGVDIKGQVELYKLIADIKRQTKCSVLMISHDLHLVMSATDHVICMNQHICCSGHPEAITSDPAYIALFGEADADSVALYAHHHNHDHNLHGDVVDSAHGECKH